MFEHRNFKGVKMRKYKLIYTVCEGNYEMDVFTGYTILASDHREAMQAAGRLNTILIEEKDFNHFKVKLHCNELKKYSIDILVNDLPVIKSKIQKFRFLKKNLKKSCTEIDDYEEVSEKMFLKSIQNEYETSTNVLTFEPISYGVDEAN
ncbi:MAG TPA: hypothetical protein DEP27_07840 [Ruminococcaceae bacterium]|nr:hypothetical protein [Oscillospiraceae bacterium]